ncbi:MAG: radical SAM protein, partial [Candidatus Latescibacterota bacterium]
MRLLLINPRNPLVNVTNKDNRWNKYRVWKPLGLMVVAGCTPPEWDITIVDENVDTPDYSQMPRPDLVGVTAFTSQAPRAYEVAATFRGRGVPVVMGGIHATMCGEEASRRVDAVVTGEAESIWARLLKDASRGTLQPFYTGDRGEMKETAPARHDLLPAGYHFGSIQTTRGCPLNCSFCSVSSFNGRSYRRRSIEDVVSEFRLIGENHVLIVDDNLIGTRRDHIARAKDLFRSMIEANLGKKWICQATINMADDEELLRLARRAGCAGVFIGFESPADEGLVEVHKKYNIQKNRDFKASVRRIQRHGISVVGSFIMGLDVDRPGIGRE